MPAVSVCDKKFTKNYRLSYLKQGIDKLHEFPNLKAILNNFSDFSIEEYDSNVFLNWLCRANKVEKIKLMEMQSDNSLLAKGLIQNEKNDQLRAQKTLNELEILFHNYLKLSERTNKQKNDIIRKMTSFGYENNQSIGIFRELYLYLQLKKNTSISEITFDDFANSNHDFRIKVNGYEINLEITGLGPNKVDLILREAFTEVGLKTINLLPLDMQLLLEINVKYLKKDKAEFEKEYIVKLLSDSIDNLMPILKNTDSGALFDKDLFGQTSMSLYNFFEFYKNPEFGVSSYPIMKIFERMTESEEALFFLKNTKSDLIVDTPIEMFSNSKSDNKKCIQLSPWHISWNEAEKERIEARLNQLQRTLEYKLRKNQLEGQKNPILVVQFDDFFFSGYDSNLIEKQNFIDRISPIVTKTFEIINKELTLDVYGVFIYESIFSKGIFFPNQYLKLDQEFFNSISLLMN